MRFILIACGALALVSPIVIACDHGKSAEQPGEKSARDLAQLVAAGGVLIDVRTPSEVADGYVRGAKNIPVDDLEQRMTEVEALTGGDKSKAIVLYCRSGRRASNAKGILERAGHTNVHNLGGLSDWPNAADVVKP